MKRIIFSITVSLALAMVLTACGGSGSGTGGDGAPSVGNISEPSQYTKTFYVDASKNAQDADGSTWTKAYSDLSKALWAVNELNKKQSGTITEIWIAKGTEPYKPTRNGLTDADTSKPREVYFTLLDNVKIYGGFAGGESTLAARPKNGDKFVNEVILSGDIGTKVDASDNVYNVVRTANLKNTAQLHDVTITGGRADSEHKNESSHLKNGGGIYNNGGNPTFTNVTINKNTAVNGGGGVINWESSPTFTNVTISNNAMTNISNGGFGGGVYNHKSNATFANVTISGNTANGNGGGVYNDGGNPTLTNVTISDNTSSAGGSGVFNSGGGNPTLTNVTISGNTSGGSGGGVYNEVGNPTLTNVTISGNTSQYNSGGGIYTEGSSTVMNIINTIIWGNKVGTTPSPTAATAGISLTTGIINIAYSIVQNAQLGGKNSVEVQDKGNSNAKIGNNRGDNKFDDPTLDAALADNGGSVQTIKIENTSPAAGAGAYVIKSSDKYYFATATGATVWKDITGGANTTSKPSGNILNQTDARGFDVKSTFTVPSGKTKVAIGAYNPYASAPTK